MAELLNMGTTALGALQQAITTTGQNISNASTEGYSRQRAQFGTLPATFNGGNYLGNGVEIKAIERAYDGFLTAEVRTRTSAYSGFQALSALSGKLDSLLADPAVGLSSAMDDFFGAIQDAANNPAGMPEREVMLAEANALADRFNYLDGRLADLDREVNSRVTTAITEINSLSSQIGELNGQIAKASAASGGRNPPNDLLDTRDELIRSLATKVSLTTVEQSDGAINIMVGTGQPLVVGTIAETLEAVPDRYNASQLVVGKVSATGRVDDISRFITGGELGMALAFRERQLQPARNELGLVALGMTATFNDQLAAGIDLRGDQGGPLFGSIAPQVLSGPVNAGSATVTVTVDDVAGVTGDDYDLRFTGGQWTLTNATTQASVTGPGPLTFEGLDIAVSGVPVEGDNYLIGPTRLAASTMSVVITDAGSIAAGWPVRSGSALTNLGSGDIDGLFVNDRSSVPLTGAVSFTFNPNALGPGVSGYDVSGVSGGPLAYDPAVDASGKRFELGGFAFSLNGVPQPGDVLQIENNSNAVGDNRNLLALADLQSADTLNNGSTSFQDVYRGLVGEVAVQTRRAVTGAETESVLLRSATSDRDSVVGVNLDEEAANLIRYQQAYQAAAQMISVADQLFQTLLDAAR